MSKTYSQSPQSEDYPVTQNRIRRRQKAAFHIGIARSINTGLQVIKVDQFPAPMAEVIEFPKPRISDEEAMGREIYLREQRLDLLHELGEQMLKAGS